MKLGVEVVKGDTVVECSERGKERFYCGNFVDLMGAGLGAVG